MKAQLNVDPISPRMKSDGGQPYSGHHKESTAKANLTGFL